eukprot:GHVU01151654.1.p2 GENE.GHVU01151654.1~~GHVU01151654.1.p2  ORF type:complete len:104 (+),score=5.55 GHVU01151654.1:800-1111(+)
MCVFIQPRGWVDKEVWEEEVVKNKERWVVGYGLEGRMKWEVLDIAILSRSDYFISYLSRDSYAYIAQYLRLVPQSFATTSVLDLRVCFLSYILPTDPVDLPLP